MYGVRAKREANVANKYPTIVTATDARGRLFEVKTDDAHPFESAARSINRQGGCFPFYMEASGDGARAAAHSETRIETTFGGW